MALKPRSMTTGERLIEEVRQQIFRDGRSYKDVATQVGVSPSTIRNLASGKTIWPRPTTLFPTLDAVGLEMRIVQKGAR